MCMFAWKSKFPPPPLPGNVAAPGVSMWKEGAVTIYTYLLSWWLSMPMWVRLPLTMLVVLAPRLWIYLIGMYVRTCVQSTVNEATKVANTVVETVITKAEHAAASVDESIASTAASMVPAQVMASKPAEYACSPLAKWVFGGVFFFLGKWLS